MNHKEAFCLMKYRCEACPNVEFLWNSRDGVTPFGIKCDSCGQMMFHTEWTKDFLMKDMKIFIDMTLERKESIVRKRVGKYWSNMKDTFSSQDEAVEKLSAVKVGEPAVVSILEVLKENSHLREKVKKLEQHINGSFWEEYRRDPT